MQLRFPSPLDGRKVSHHFRAITSIQLGITQKQEQGHSVNQSVFYLKTPPSFSIIFSISRLTWRESLAWKGQCSLDFLLILHSHDPHLHSHPAYCFSIQEGCASPPSPPPYSHSPPAPASFGPVPYFPPTIASPVTIIFLFHWTAPRGYGVWRWRQDLSLNWQHRCCAFWLTTLIVDVQSISDEKSLMGWLDVDFYNVFWTMLKKWGLIQLMSRRLTDWLTEGKELKITNYSNSYDQLCNSGEIKYKLCINYNDVANKPNVNTYIIAAINTTTTTTASAT